MSSDADLSAMNAHVDVRIRRHVPDTGVLLVTRAIKSCGIGIGLPALGPGVALAGGWIPWNICSMTGMGSAGPDCRSPLTGGGSSTGISFRPTRH
ncbi:hypothetical protein [Streptomyces sp. NPDC052107]|uniref:hypothetical protein n=1 Tax=Streptomyces sp. NPDC052107 TaxID=3155632 RepID=UPI003422F836